MTRFKSGRMVTSKPVVSTTVMVFGCFTDNRLQPCLMCGAKADWFYDPAPAEGTARRSGPLF
jgi:hypothetical protein